METPQVAAISMSKQSMLTAEQRDAIKTVTDSDPIEQDPWDKDVKSTGFHVTTSVLSILGSLLVALYINH